MIAVLHIIQYEIFEVYDELETFWSLNTPQTIKDIRGHHFFKPVSETPWQFQSSILLCHITFAYLISDTVRVMCKKQQQNKTKKPAKRTRNGTEILHTTPQGHTRGY